MNFGVKSIYFLNTSLPFFSSASSSVLTTLHPADSGTNQTCYPRLKPGDLHAAPQPLGNHSPRVRGTHTKKTKTHKICTRLSSTDGIPSSRAAGTRPHCCHTACSTGPGSVRPPCPNLQLPEHGVLSAFPALSEGVCGWDLGMGGSWAGCEGGQGTGEIASGSGSGSGSGSCSQPGAWRPREPQPPQGSRERATGVHK